MGHRWAAAVCAAALVSCSSSTPRAVGPVLPTADVPAAVAAAKGIVPGAQFTEINVSPGGVNVFVVTSPGKETSYLFARGASGEPSAEQASEGEPFSVEGVPLDQGTKVAAFAAAQFKGSTVTSVALLVVKPNGLVWAVRSQSVKGGLLNTLFSPDGHVISALPAN